MDASSTPLTQFEASSPSADTLNVAAPPEEISTAPPTMLDGAYASIFPSFDEDEGALYIYRLFQSNRTLSEDSPESNSPVTVHFP